MNRVLGSLFERLDDHALDVPVCYRARLAWPRLVAESIEAMPGKAAAPLCDRRATASQPSGDIRALLTGGRGQHDAASESQRNCALFGRRAQRSKISLVIRECHFCALSSSSHRCLPSS